MLEDLEEDFSVQAAATSGLELGTALTPVVWQPVQSLFYTCSSKYQGLPPFANWRTQQQTYLPNQSKSSKRQEKINNLRSEPRAPFCLHGPRDAYKNAMTPHVRRRLPSTDAEMPTISEGATCRSTVQSRGRMSYTSACALTTYSYTCTTEKHLTISFKGYPIANRWLDFFGISSEEAILHTLTGDKYRYNVLFLQ